jgi:hypothetical protein
MEDRNRLLVLETMKIIDDRNLHKLKQIKLILNNTFGEANNQIIKEDPFPQLDSLELSETQFSRYFQITLKDVFRYKVVIYFPEITLSNMNRNSHTIKDLYFSVLFKTDLKVEGTIRGMRTTFTRDEWVSQYTHSHLSGLCTTFRDFCTGTGPINQVISILKTEYDEINFEMFCYHIKTFLEYESIEGTPFKYLEQIGTDRNITTIDEYTYLAQLNFIYKEFLQTFDLTELKLLLRIKVKTLIEVESTDEFEKRLGSLLVELKNHGVAGLNLLQYLNDGDLLSHKISPTHYTNIHSEGVVTYTPYVLLNFKGQEKRLLIVTPPVVENQKIYYANPHITKYICQRLSRNFSIHADQFNFD